MSVVAITHQPYPGQLKVTPNDIIKYNGHSWVAIAISIQDGQTVLIARLEEDRETLVHEYIKPHIDTCEYGLMHTDLAYADWMRIIHSDHDMMLMYF